MLYFVDESGIDLKEAPCSVLAGVGMREADVWPFAQAFLSLKEEILRFTPEHVYEAKGMKLLKRRVFRHAQLADEITPEDRNAAIERLLAKNERSEPVGRDELAALAQAKLVFVAGALDLARDFGMTFFASIVPKGAPQQRDRSFLRKDFAYLFERVHCHVCDGPDHTHGVLIFDEQDKALSQTLLDQMHGYFVETSRGRQRAERLIPMPFFVHSELTPPIQLADLVAYVTNRGLRTERMPEPARAELRPFADKVFELRYQYAGEGSPNRIFGGKLRKSGIAYIDDLRTRRERELEEDALDETQAPAA